MNEEKQPELKPKSWDLSDRVTIELHGAQFVFKSPRDRLLRDVAKALKEKDGNRVTDICLSYLVEVHNFNLAGRAVEAKDVIDLDVPHGAASEISNAYFKLALEVLGVKLEPNAEKKDLKIDASSA